jgi:hypothetical protein
MTILLQWPRITAASVPVRRRLVARSPVVATTRPWPPLTAHHQLNVKGKEAWRDI